jgi:mandelamide amidase
LGLPRSYFWEDLDPGVRATADTALARLRSAGVEFVPIDLPDIAELDGEISFVVALHEFVRDMTAYLRDRSRGITFEQLIAGIGSADVKAIAMPLIRGGAVPEATYQHALEARKRLQALYAETFARTGVSALVFPTAPSTAARIGEDETFDLNGRACPTFATFIRNTDPGSNAALPGLSLPIGLSGGLPVGLAFDGPAASDRHLLAIGRAIEAALPPMPLAPIDF